MKESEDQEICCETVSLIYNRKAAPMKPQKYGSGILGVQGDSRRQLKGNDLSLCLRPKSRSQMDTKGRERCQLSSCCSYPMGPGMESMLLAKAASTCLFHSDLWDCTEINWFYFSHCLRKFILEAIGE